MLAKNLNLSVVSYMRISSAVSKMKERRKILEIQAEHCKAC